MTLKTMVVVFIGSRRGGSRQTDGGRDGCSNALENRCLGFLHLDINPSLRKLGACSVQSPYFTLNDISSLESECSGFRRRALLSFNSALWGETLTRETPGEQPFSYFHSKQPLQKHLRPLPPLRTVASFQGHHLRALLIIWQVFSKINYCQLPGCNYAGRWDSVNLLRLSFQAQFSTYQDAKESQRFSKWLADARIIIRNSISGKQIVL